MASRRLGSDKVSRGEHHDTSFVTIIIDTNTLMLVGKGYQFFEDVARIIGLKFRCVVPMAVIEELMRIWHVLSIAERRRARLGLSLLLSRCPLVNGNMRYGKVDDVIVDYALQLRRNGHRVYVATSDRELRRRLRKLGIPSIYFREESRSFEAEWEPAC